MLDVAIVGGSAAGLSAGLTLGRFRRKVLIFDDQSPRNRFAEHAQNFFTRDGTPPSEILAIGRKQLEPYETVSLLSERVVEISKEDDVFTLVTAGGESYQSRYVLLATGIKDELPQIEELAQFWGKRVHHCPFCHGWEVRDKRVMLVADGTKIVHFAKLLMPLASELVGVLHDAPALTADERVELERLGVTVHDGEITAVSTQNNQLNGVLLKSGELIPCDDMFVVPTVSQSSAFAEALGCELDENGFVKVDPMGRTSVPHLFAAGDMTTPFQQIIFAAAGGAGAGAGIVAELLVGQ